MSISSKVEQALLLLSEVLEELHASKLTPSVQDSVREVARQQAMMNTADIHDQVKVSHDKWGGEQVEVYDFGSTEV